jgi:hypothetical protein
MTEPDVRVRAAVSSMTDHASSVVRTVFEVVLGGIEKSARFVVSTEPCDPANQGRGVVAVDMPKHTSMGKPLTAEVRRVEPGILTTTAFAARAEWVAVGGENEARARIDLEPDPTKLPAPYEEVPPGLFVGRVECEPDKPGRPRPCSRFVIYEDGLP